MKKMSYEDLKKVKEFYDNVIMQQIILPIEINEILLLVNPNAHTMQPYYKKMREITIFIQKYQGEVFENFKDLMEATDKELDEADDPRGKDYIHKEDTLLKKETPSKSEDMPPEEQSHQEVTEPTNHELVGLQNEIDYLESEYENADSNKKRSITHKLKKLKKQL